MVGTLKVYGATPSNPVDITYAGDDGSQGIKIVDGGNGLFENCSIGDIQHSGIICEPGSEISLNEVEVDFDGNDKPGVTLDGCTINKFDNSLIMTDSSNTEVAVEFSDITSGDIRNSTFIGAEGDGASDISISNSDFSMYDCKFNGPEDTKRIRALSSSTLNAYGPQLKNDPTDNGLSMDFVELDPTSEINVFWYLNVTAEDVFTTDPLEGVKIEADSMNIEGPQGVIGYTKSNGNLFWFPLQMKKIEEMEEKDFSDYEIEGTYLTKTQMAPPVKMNGKQDPFETAVDFIILGFDLRSDLNVTSVTHNPIPSLEGDVINITANVINNGMTETTDATVSFYNGDPEGGGVQIGTTQNIYLEESGQMDDLDVYVDWTTNVGDAGDYSIYVVVDNSGGDGDAQPFDNNWTDYKISLVKIGVDYSVETDNITFWDEFNQPVNDVIDGDKVTIKAEITNTGKLVGNAEVNFYNNGTISLGERINIAPIPINLNAGESTNVSVVWDTTWQGAENEDRDIIVNITNLTYDMFSVNNKAQKTFGVKAYRNLEMTLTSSEKQSVIGGGAPAIYDVDVKNHGRVIENIDYTYQVTDIKGDISNWTIGLDKSQTNNLKHNGTDNIQLQVQPTFGNYPVPGDYVVIEIKGESQNDVTIFETVMTNTTYGQPDLILTELTQNLSFYREYSNEEVSSKGKSLIVNEMSMITASIENIGLASTGEDIIVRFYNSTTDIANAIGNATITGGLSKDIIKTASIQYQFIFTGTYTIWVKVDPDGLIAEDDELNNDWSANIDVKSETPANTFNVNGFVYDIDGNPLENANVAITDPYTFTTSDTDGYYSLTLNQIDYTEGKELTITGTSPTDPSEQTKTVYAYSEDSPNELDLYLKIEGVDLQIISTNIKFFREMDRGEIDEPIFEEFTTVTATIRNRGTEDAEDFFVNFTWGAENLKNGNKVTISIPAKGTMTVKQIVPNEPVETSKNAVLFMTPGGGFPPIGKQTVKIEISNLSGGVDDAYKDNNYAFREVRVKDNIPTGSLRIFGTVFDSKRNPVSSAVVNITNLNPDLDFSTEVPTGGTGDYEYFLINYREGDEIVITASGEDGTGSLSFYSYSEDGQVRKDIMFDKYEIELSVDDKSKETDDNLMVEYFIEIENIGTKTDEYTLTIGTHPGEWTVWLNATGNNTIILDSGMTGYVKLLIKAPGPGEKDAYEELMLGLEASSINGAYDEIFVFATISPIYALPSVTPMTSQSDSAVPGESVTYQWDVSNNGNSDDKIFIELTGDTDWASPLSPLNLNPKGSVGESDTIILKVTVPVNALENDQGVIFVSFFGGSGDKTTPIQTTTTALKVDKIPSFSITPFSKKTAIGIPATYDVYLTNNGNGNNDITIDGTGTWTTKINTGTLPYIVNNVGADETRKITLSVTPPADKLAGESDITTLTAKIGILESEQVTVETIVGQIDIKPLIEFIDGETSISDGLKQGESKTYEIEINNQGNYYDTIYTSLAGDLSWASTIPSISLNAGELGIVKITIKIPKNEIAESESNIYITSTSGKSGLVSDPISLKITVVQGYSVDIEAVNEISKTIKLGDSTIYKIKVKNIGDLADNYILKVDEVDNPDEKWNLEQIYINVGLIGAGDSKNVNVLVNAPMDAPFKDYKIKVYAISETFPDIKSTEIGLTTKVHKPPEPSSIQFGSAPPFYSNTDITFSVTDDQLTYSWNFDDGTDVKPGASVTHKFSRPGTYHITLTAMDSTGAMGTRMSTIDIINQKPIVKITNPGPTTTVGIDQIIDFNGEAKDNNGDIEYVVWDFGDGNKISNVNPEEIVTIKYSYSKTGTYSITLTGKDNFGEEVISEPIKVIVENKAPEAVFTIPKDIVFKTNMEIDFDASSSLDADGSIISYEWDFGDGTTGVGVNLTHIYIEKGDYEVKLTVTDDNGVKHISTQQISVIKPEEKSYTIHWIIGIALILILAIMIVGILFGGREEFFSRFNERIKQGLDEKKQKEEKTATVPTDIEYKLHQLEHMIEEKGKDPPVEEPQKIETSAGILEEVSEPEVKDLLEVNEFEEPGLLEEIRDDDSTQLRPGTIDELSEAFAATLVNLARGRDELAKIEERIADTLKDERDKSASEIRKITKDYEFTQRKIDALDSLARMRRMQAGEEKIAAIFRGEVPEEDEYDKHGFLEDVGDSPLGELEEIEDEEFDEIEDDELMEDDLESLEEDDELLEDLEDLEEEEETSESDEEMAECGACGEMIPVAASKCPKCGAEFEED